MYCDYYGFSHHVHYYILLLGLATQPLTIATYTLYQEYIANSYVLLIVEYNMNSITSISRTKIVYKFCAPHEYMVIH